MPKKHNKFLKYIIFSLIPFLGDFALYNFLILILKFNIYIAFSISFIFGSILAFLITPFVFKNKLDFKKYYLKFLFIEIFILFLGEIVFLYFFYDILKLDYFFARIFAVGIVFSFSFLLKNKLFKK